jgi:glutathione S-transferase
LKLNLYYAPIACSLVPYVGLLEAGARFEVTVIDFSRGAHLSEEYLRVNPKHAVPVLIIDGEPLTENVAILQWIAETYPHANLLPGDGLRRFEAIAFLAWCASGIHPHLTPNALPQRYCDLPDSDESVRRCAQKLLREKFRMAETVLGDRKWFFGNFSLADVYFFWCFRRATIFKADLAEFSNCQGHLARMSERASVKALLAFEAETLAELRRGD